MKYLLFLVLFVSPWCVNGQDDVPDLITDRPDQTESSSVVPYKSLQIETGFVMENKATTLVEQKAFAYNTTLLRYGLLENFELRLGLEYLQDEVSIKHTDTTHISSGLSPLYLGFKVKIADEDGWKPEIAFLGGLVLPFTAHQDFKPSYSAANIRFSLAHTLSDNISFGYNLGAEWDGDSPVPGYFYSAALGYGMGDKLGMFVEAYGLFYGDGESEHLFDVGFTYLVLPNFQLDVSGGVGFNDLAIDNFVSFGLTYRLPT